MTFRRVAVASAVLLCAAAACPAQGTAGFDVIVNPANPATAISTGELSDIFLRKTTQWPSGLPVEPVDLAGEGEVREAFSRLVHARTAAAVKNYWNQQVFSGRGVPPPELVSSSDVARYVAGRPGAVGYVEVGGGFPGVKVLGVIIPPTVVHRVEPVYSSSAAAARISGEVVLSVEVDKDGRVANVVPVKGLPMGLTSSAMRAVEKWRFNPGTLNGQPIPQTVQVVVRFGAPAQ